MDYRVSESLEDENSFLGSWFDGARRNAVSSCEMANSLEWKQRNIVNALNAILTRKIAGCQDLIMEDRLSDEDEGLENA